MLTKSDLKKNYLKEIKKISKFRYSQYFDEAGLSTLVLDQEYDYPNLSNNFEKKTIFSKIFLIIKYIIFNIKLWIGIIFFQMIISTFYKEKKVKKNIIFNHNYSNKKNLWFKNLNLKNFTIYNFTAPYPSIKERLEFGKFSHSIFYLSLKLFIKSSFISLSQPSLTNFFYCLVELLKIEKFYTYLISIKLNKILSKKNTVYMTYENLPRENVLLKYLKSPKIIVVFKNPTHDYESLRWYNLRSRLKKMSNIIFFYEEKYLSLKSCISKNSKIKVLNKKIIDNSKINFILKKKYSNIIFVSSNSKNCNFFLIKYMSLFKKKKILIKYHPSNHHFNSDEDRRISNILKKKNNLIFCSSYTNYGFFAYNYKNNQVVILNHSSKEISPYKYIDLNQIGINKLINYINKL